MYFFQRKSGKLVNEDITIFELLKLAKPIYYLGFPENELELEKINVGHF